MRKNLQITVFMIFILIFVSVGWAVVFANTPVALGQEQLIRLHVLANSDHPEDQQLKFKVRDAIIAYLSPQLENLTTPEAARKIILEHQDELAAIARRVLVENGSDYPVNVQFGSFDFPVKSYGNFVLPAGNYEAVRILIGKAEGKNWWCVLFPPLCFIDITNATAIPVTGDDADKAAEKPERRVEIKWKIAEVFNLD